MPCKKCKDENYKWGNTGECKYATKEACEKANPKKYNKMRPTPLGKKTYEEYAKELKEFNLSSEVKKVELGILQDGQKISERVKAEIKKAQDQIADLTKFSGRANDVVKVINGMRKDIETELKKFDNASTAVGEEKRDLFMTSQKLKDAVAELDKISNELTTVAKDMGVDVPGLADFKRLAAQGKSFDNVIEKAYNGVNIPQRPSQSF
tara:strand:- start:2851 stop:3474 length:624 start_codon:yes stop_codon:yes gene_type:complete